ncbi:Histidine phosphatase superfamily [Phytophthora cactorum]|nr:Histidine phosphatase superfamily [Phytophthora cactorum]
MVRAFRLASALMLASSSERRVKVTCPRNKANLDAYKVPLTQLTEIGMKQLQAVGEHIRHTYMVDEPQHEEAFLSRSLNGVNHSHFEAYFRADAATRCSQSATAVGYGLYPDGTGPNGFPHQPVPITMQLVENEHAFAAPKGPCKSTLDADLAVYAETRAPELFDQYRDVLDQLVVLGVKDLADMFVFDRDEGLPLPEGMTVEAREKLEQLAFTNLMERYYSTDREITYWYRYFSFHGHRELLHGLGMMLGWEFHFKGLPTALNVSSLHPGTTMFFELRARKLTTEEAQKQPEAKEAYFREQIKLTKCSVADCPLDEFSNIISNHIASTGTWETICNYHKPAWVKGPGVEGNHGFARCSFLTVIGLAMMVGLALAAFKVYSARRRGYTM